MGRFDTPADDVGYFAEAPETAVYEALARREKTSLSMDELQKRLLIVLRTVRPIRLLDLRPHANAFPVLQSFRFDVTQSISTQVHAAGYDGIAYRSAQQFGADCYALYGDAMRALRAASRAPLLQPGTNALHRAVAAALRGSQIPLTP